MGEERLDAVQTYVADVIAQRATGHAAEHAYRPALKHLIERVAEVDAVNDPKRSAHGAPDFVFLKKGSKDLILGWAEAKDLDANLDSVQKSEQLLRYAGYQNLFLTDYLEFRFFSNGSQYESVSVGELLDGTVIAKPEGFQALSDALVAFLGRAPAPITSGVRLAEVMGAKARRIRHNVEEFLKADDGTTEELMSIFMLIKETLVHDLDPVRFADMYAQTLVYGLFAARYNDTSLDTFSRAEARDLVPSSNPFLQKFFDHIAGASFDPRLAHIVDELCEVFTASDVREIVSRHLSSAKDERDPIIHFYEDFLKVYDPQQRKAMGAYYTPLPVVEYMVSEVDRILREEFDLSQGLTDSTTVVQKGREQGRPVTRTFHKVQVLDPAVGTATFLNEIVKFNHRRFEGGQEGQWPGYVQEDLVPRIHGFELMMAPYTVAHLKLGLTLAESGVPNPGRRLGIYLTNTLEEGLERPQNLFQQPGLAGAVSTEAIEAGEIKNERPIMVVIGNPPYSGISSNETDFANTLIKHYKVEPGGVQALQERKHWLNDDYVKFFAFAESAINRNGSGIVALVTNHGYLDNPTFRGMRWRLRESFDKIYVLDLHGNSKKRERSLDGSPDKNVFDIQQGVAIFIGVKLSKKKKLAQVWSGDLLGSRAQKFDALRQGDIEMLPISPQEPMHYFKSFDLAGRKEYESGISLDDLFRKKVAGIVTARDYLSISFDPGPLLETVRTMADSGLSDAEVRQKLFPGKKDGKYLAGDSRGWKLTEARKLVAQEDWTSKLRSIDYRPFDTRQIYYSQSMVDWPRFELMSNFDQTNVGLIFNRTIEQDRDFSDIFVTKNLIQHHSLSIKEVNYVAPLYLYDEGGRVPNLDAEMVRRLSATLGSEPKPEQILAYAYGVLNSRRYRSKFREFLRRGFPRIPVPDSPEQFDYFVEYGENLRELHLLGSTDLDQSTTFPIPGTSIVEKPVYKQGSVYINKEQYFGEVSETMWNSWIGGYQPARKWLADRKGRKLTSKDIRHYQSLLATLEQTALIMDSLDDGHDYW